MEKKVIINIEKCKNIIAKERGYPDWITFENWIINNNDSCATALILVKAMEEVSVLNHFSLNTFK